MADYTRISPLRASRFPCLPLHLLFHICFSFSFPIGRPPSLASAKVPMSALVLVEVWCGGGRGPRRKSTPMARSKDGVHRRAELTRVTNAPGLTTLGRQRTRRRSDVRRRSTRRRSTWGGDDSGQCQPASTLARRRQQEGGEGKGGSSPSPSGQAHRSAHQREHSLT